MTPEQLGYIALAATAIGIIVRLLKQDVTFLPTVPSRYRPLVALALGAVASVLEIVAAGALWKRAIFDGLVASFSAMAGHGVVIESLRGGREIGVSKLVTPEDAPTAPLPLDPPSVP